MTISDVSDDCFMGDHECTAVDCDCICHYEDSFGLDEDGSDEEVEVTSTVTLTWDDDEASSRFLGLRKQLLHSGYISDADGGVLQVLVAIAAVIGGAGAGSDEGSGE